MKLIKLSDTHFIVVDDSPIQNGMICYYKHPMHENGMVTKVIDKKYSDYAPYAVMHEEGFGVIEGYRKITHSTQPLNDKPHFAEYGLITLSEVKELIGEVDVQKKIYPIVERVMGNHNMQTSTGRDMINIGISCYNQALEDNKNKVHLSDVFRVLDLHTDSAPISYLKRELEKFFQPKTEWDVEFIDHKLKLKK